MVSAYYNLLLLGIPLRLELFIVGSEVGVGVLLPLGCSDLFLNNNLFICIVIWGIVIYGTNVNDDPAEKEEVTDDC